MGGSIPIFNLDLVRYKDIHVFFLFIYIYTFFSPYFATARGQASLLRLDAIYLLNTGFAIGPDT